MNVDVLNRMLADGARDVTKACKTCGNDDVYRNHIARYYVALATNSLAWMVKTMPTAWRSSATWVLRNRVRRQSDRDYSGMLHIFLQSCGCVITSRHYEASAVECGLIEGLFRDSNLATLHGLALATCFGTWSPIFIPELRRIASLVGCQDFEYLDTQLQLSTEFAPHFLQALAEEASKGFDDKAAYEAVNDAFKMARNLLKFVFFEPTHMS